MGEWQEKKLADIAQLSKNSWKVGEDPAPYIGLEHIEENKLRLNSKGHSDEVGSNKYKFEAGDTLFGKLRPYFRKVVKPDFSGICSTDIWVIKPKNEVDENFLFYFFANEELVDLAYSSSGGTRMPRADWNFMKETKWPVPPLPTQRAIASMLSSLDDKIDLLHRQNATLEALAETLFRQWFLEEAGEDWEEGVLEDIIEFNPSYPIIRENPTPYLEMSNISGNKFNPDYWYDREYKSGMRFKNYDTLLARITPCLENGKTCFVTFLEEGEVGWGSTEYIVMKMKESFHPFTSYLIAKNKEFRDYAISTMSGSSGRQRAKAEVVKKFKVHLPPKNIVDHLNTQLNEILPKLINNSKQIRTLEKLRDTLLPKLMSGEVSIQKN